MRRLRAALLSSPLRSAKGRTLAFSSWSGYIATRYVESSEYILTRSLRTPRASPLREHTPVYIHTFSCHTRSSRSRSSARFSLSESLFLVSRPLFSFDTCTGIRIRNVHHSVQLPTLLLIPAILRSVKSRLLCILWNYIFLYLWTLRSEKIRPFDHR